MHGTVSQFGGDTAATGEGGQNEPLPVHREDSGRLSAQQGAHGQAVLRRRVGPTASTGRKQVRRPEEPEEAPAQDVRPGPGQGRSGNDDGQRGLPAGRPEQVQRDGRRRRRRRRRGRRRRIGVRDGLTTRGTAGGGRVRLPSRAITILFFSTLFPFFFFLLYI